MNINLDKCNVDACYAGTQKGLNCPPGLSPVTFSERAMKKINDRESDISEWYLDVKLIAKYLDVPAKDAKRSYHHTAPVSNVYALHEALRLVLNEGLDNVEKRHRETAKYFWDKLESTELDNGEKF